MIKIVDGKNTFLTKKRTFNPISPGGGADLSPLRAKAFTRKNQWVEILITFLYSYLRFPRPHPQVFLSLKQLKFGEIYGVNFSPENRAV